jgi:hypothetical protein
MPEPFLHGSRIGAARERAFYLQAYHKAEAHSTRNRNVKRVSLYFGRKQMLRIDYTRERQKEELFHRCPHLTPCRPHGQR